MVDVGYFSLTLALLAAAFSAIASVVGARTRNAALVASGKHGIFAVFGMLTLAMGVLIHALVTGNFQLEYVASYTSSQLSTFYRITALWAGQDGSLLLWGWTLALFAVVVALQNRDRNRVLMPYVHATLMVITFFFIVLNVFVANPFDLLPFTPQEGRGLNPILQMPLMIIHPPVLYQGYVGVAVPFAFAIAALITRELGDTWIRTIRRWTLYPWFFLGVGLILGGRWAYVELGWGGYWAWDPVENAALMPWLTLTAFLHSVMIQEKKGMLKIWNVTLVLLTFGLSIFGTFLTRSGIVASVHSFTQSGVGPMFLGFVAVSMVFSFGLLISRKEALKARSELDSFVSRESSFLLNNLALVGACFAILWGTIFPVLSEAVRGTKITVSAPYFNQINVPLGIFLLFLTGAGPMLAWRKTSVESLKRHFTVPIVFFGVTLVALLVAGIGHVYALLSLSMCAFVAGAILLEFYRGMRARHSTNDEAYPLALLRLILAYKRRYGGYVVHLGIVVMFVGFTGAAFNIEEDHSVRKGESFTVKNYTMRFEDLNQTDHGEYTAYVSALRLSVDGVPSLMVMPEKRFYPLQEQVTSEVAIRTSVQEDLYVVLAELNESLDVATFKIYVNPLVNWVWIGTGLLMLGTMLLFLPDHFGRRSSARQPGASESTPRTSPESEQIAVS
ncbi:MAG: heme lyase CcmF/NrfE family subunit [candidate division Zixibacteria bacterium]|nr:heme lyase CcmF/NrfE family subunit [candidate division Zixibacteria bacterium]